MSAPTDGKTEFQYTEFQYMVLKFHYFFYPPWNLKNASAACAAPWTAKSLRLPNARLR
jgi:hypothetical protein